MPVELVVADERASARELVRATGTRAFVESLGALPDAPDEEGVFAALGLPFVPPELREGPYAGPPPALVELEQIRGDLHVHTTSSDGKASVLEMGEAARALGYEYLAICDHTRNVRVVPGLDADDVRRQAEEIAAANERARAVSRAPRDRVRHPSRRDARPARRRARGARLGAGERARGPARDARRDDEARGRGAAASQRLVPQPPEGADHQPPSGERARPRARVRGRVEEGKAVEVNGLPDRLDLRDVHVRLAVESGVPIVCSTDAHSTRGLGNMQLSVATARRGGATAADVLNTRPLSELPIHLRGRPSS